MNMNIRLLYKYSFFCVWFLLGCQTTTHKGSNTPQKDTVEVTSAQEKSLESEHSEESSQTNVTHEYQPPKERQYICPNGWRQEREMPSYSLDEHELFLKDLPSLDDQRVLIELRISRVYKSNAIGTKFQGFDKPLLLVEPKENVHGFSKIEFDLADKQQLFLPPFPIDDCILFEKYEGDMLMRLVLKLDVNMITLDDGMKKAVVTGMIQ